MTAHAFAITALDSGKLVGIALVCPQARYAGVLSPRDRRIDRRFIAPREWIAIEHELDGHETGPLRADSAVSKALKAEKSVAVQFLHATPVDAPVEGTATALDSRLLELA